MKETKIVIITSDRNKHYSRLLELFPPNTIAVEDEEDAEVYVFADNYDIHPFLYGELKQHKTITARYHINMQQLFYYNKALSLNIPMIGFETGAHLINVMNGGRMFQHVYGHEDYHMVFSHDGCLFDVTSNHHQLMTPYNLLSYQYKVLVGSYDICGSFYNGNDEDIDLPENFCEPETIYFPMTDSLAIQPNPLEDEDKMFQNSINYYKELIQNFINYNMKEYNCLT